MTSPLSTTQPVSETSTSPENLLSWGIRKLEHAAAVQTKGHVSTDNLWARMRVSVSCRRPETVGRSRMGVWFPGLTGWLRRLARLRERPPASRELYMSQPVCWQFLRCPLRLVPSSTPKLRWRGMAKRSAGSAVQPQHRTPQKEEAMGISRLGEVATKHSSRGRECFAVTGCHPLRTHSQGHE
jgi:hypothetical protein